MNHLNLGIWFLNIQRSDNFFHSMKVLVEKKDKHLTNKHLFPFVKNERSRLILEISTSPDFQQISASCTLIAALADYKLFDIPSESITLYFQQISASCTLIAALADYELFDIPSESPSLYISLYISNKYQLAAL